MLSKEELCKSMHPLLYVMLLAGGTLAYYRRGGYATHNLFEREELEENESYKRKVTVPLVPCPVCDDHNKFPYNNEECSIMINGSSYKQCRHGTYYNERCDNRLDCYRGVKEICTEKMTEDLFNQRCAPGYYCEPTENRCQANSTTDSRYNIYRYNNGLYLVPNDRNKAAIKLLLNDIRDRQQG